jgi:hypothetical protein
MNPQLPDMGLDYCIAVSEDGSPYIAFARKSDGKASLVRYSDGAWVHVGSEAITDSAVGYISLAISREGTPYLAFANRKYFNKLSVVAFVKGAWRHLGAETVTSYAVDATALSVKGPDSIFIVTNSPHDMRGASAIFWDGIAWRPYAAQTLSNGWSRTPGISAANDGSVWICFHDGSLQQGSVLRSDGISWQNPMEGRTSAPAMAFPAIATHESTVFLGFIDDQSKAGIAVLQRYDSGNVGISFQGEVSQGKASLVQLGVSRRTGIPYLLYDDRSIEGRLVVTKASIDPLER